VISRRRVVRAVAGVAVAGIAIPQLGSTQRNESEPEGRIAFVKEGNIYAWSPETGVRMVVEDGRAMDPTWQPGANYLLYVRDGGSYSNLILANSATGRTRRLTDNESVHEYGSPDYVADSVWAMDPSWSRSGIVCYASNQDSPYGDLRLWILDPAAETTYLAAWDGVDGGSLEQVSVDGDGVYAAYTVLVGGWGGGSSTYVSLRDLASGTTYPLIEGPRGAYDPAISRDGDWVIASIRDGDGVSDLWLCNRADETVSRLTEGEQASNATWSPDGEWVAYLSLEGAGFALKAIRVDVNGRNVVGEPRTLAGADRIDSTSGLSWNTL
jgi:Tol biopolymer transport system component